MRRAVVMLLAAVGVMGIGALSSAQKAADEKVIAYYFHGAFRCSTCTKMETYSREAIEANFRDALDGGRLEFKAVNVEEKGNEHFAEDYRLYTKALILSYVKDGKEMRSKNLDKIWDYAGNKQRFIAYITDEVGKFLNEVQ